MDEIILEFYIGMIIGYLILKNKFLPVSSSIFIFLFSLLYLFFSNNIFDFSRVFEVGFPAALLVYSTISLEKYIQGRIPKMILFFGAASYVLYLFHPLISLLAPVLLHKVAIESPLLSVLFSVSLALIVSAIIHRWIEQPLLVRFRK